MCIVLTAASDLIAVCDAWHAARFPFPLSPLFLLHTQTKPTTNNLNRDLEIIRRMQRGAFAHPEFDAYAPQVDVFCDEEVRCSCVAFVRVFVYSVLERVGAALEGGGWIRRRV